MREPQRHHRWLTAPSGWLLFFAVFLPAWQPCSTGNPLPMAFLPPAWPPYIAGLLVALVAMASTRRDIETRGAVLLAMVRFTAIAVVVVGIVSMIDDGVLIETAIAVKAGTVVALLVPWRGTEQGIAQTTFVIGCAIFALMASRASAPSALWGVHVAAVGAGGIAVGSAWWWIELVRAHAVVRSR